MNESDLTPVSWFMILKLSLKPKIPDQRKQLDCSEFMFRNKPGHIAGNKCKQEPDAIVPFMKERAN